MEKKNNRKYLLGSEVKEICEHDPMAIIVYSNWRAKATLRYVNLETNEVESKTIRFDDFLDLPKKEFRMPHNHPKTDYYRYDFELAAKLAA